MVETEFTLSSKHDHESSSACEPFLPSISLTFPTNELIDEKNSPVSDHYTPQLLFQIRQRQLLCTGESLFAGVTLNNQGYSVSFATQLTLAISVSNIDLHSIIWYYDADMSSPGCVCVL